MAVMFTVTVERGSTSSKGAKPGHVWMIRVTNTTERSSTIIVTNLTVATADHVAEQLAAVIGAAFYPGRPATAELETGGHELVAIGVGDKYLGIACVWTVAATGDDVTLTHPVAGEWSMPLGDFVRLVTTGSLEPFTG